MNNLIRKSQKEKEEHLKDCKYLDYNNIRDEEFRD